ncbi:hypothetical protein QWZ03_02655 [Chitinimonas viridis]|uniref:Uncharacterized protein n=1 Tax=Chitinimonas viridis TaxID=664880 RepID=A0ABT8B0Y2_9NEIS|nr:hypothetical protein [Chitinimonas viridis]MDN3575670.1 hypothetical protein [Chitinimonas viridis]
MLVNPIKHAAIEPHHPPLGMGMSLFFFVSVLCLLIALGLFLISSSARKLGPIALDSEQRVWIAIDDHLVITQLQGQVVGEVDTSEQISTAYKVVVAWKQGGVLLDAADNGHVYRLDRQGQIVGTLPTYFMGTVLLAYAASSDTTYVLEQDAGVLRAYQGDTLVAERKGYQDISSMSLSPDGRLWLLDRHNARLLAHDSHLQPVKAVLLPAAFDAVPPNQAQAGPDGSWWITGDIRNWQRGRMLRMDRQGQALAAPALPWWSMPAGLAMLPDGSWLVTEARRSRVLQLDPQGQVQGQFGDSALQEDLSRHRWRHLKNPFLQLCLAMMVGLMIYGGYIIWRDRRPGPASSPLFATPANRDNVGKLASLALWAVIVMQMFKIGVPLFSADFAAQLCQGTTDCQELMLLELGSRFVVMLPIFMFPPHRIPGYDFQTDMPVLHSLLDRANTHGPALRQAVEAAGGCYFGYCVKNALLLVCHDALLVVRLRSPDYSLESLQTLRYEDLSEFEAVGVSFILDAGSTRIRFKHGAARREFETPSPKHQRTFLAWLQNMHPATRDSWLAEQHQTLVRRTRRAHWFMLLLCGSGLATLLALGATAYNAPLTLLLALLLALLSVRGVRRPPPAPAPMPLAP